MGAAAHKRVLISKVGRIKCHQIKRDENTRNSPGKGIFRVRNHQQLYFWTLLSATAPSERRKKYILLTWRPFCCFRRKVVRGFGMPEDKMSKFMTRPVKMGKEECEVVIQQTKDKYGALHVGVTAMPADMREQLKHTMRVVGFFVSAFFLFSNWSLVFLFVMFRSQVWEVAMGIGVLNLIADFVWT